MNILTTLLHKFGIWRKEPLELHKNDSQGNLLIHLLRAEIDPWLDISSYELAKCTSTSSESFSDQARRHGLDAFAFRMINQLGWRPMLNHHEHEQLMQRSLLHYQYLTQIREGYTHIVNNLSPGFGPMIPLKGIYLSNTLYTKKLDRQFGDIDLLISLDDVQRLVNILDQMGFVSDPYRSNLERKNPTMLSHHLPPFRKGNLMVEIHTRLLPSTPSLWTRDFIESSQEVPRSPGIALPDPIHHLLFLIAHLDKHAENGQAPLRLFRDLALLTGKNSLVWPAVSEFARTYGLDGMLVGVRDELSHLYAWKVNENMQQYMIPKRTAPNRWRRIKIVLNQLPGIRVKVILIWRWIFPQAEYIRFHHPGYSKFHLILWYPGRILLVIWRSLFS